MDDQVDSRLEEEETHNGDAAEPDEKLRRQHARQPQQPVLQPAVAAEHLLRAGMGESRNWVRARIDGEENV